MSLLGAKSGNNNSFWDDVVNDLERQGGMAVVSLEPNLEMQHSESFEVARRALDAVTTTTTTTTTTTEDNNKDCDADADADDDHSKRTTVWIPPESDPAHVTGYHPPGTSNGLSRYNAQREGFIFSNGGTLQVQGIPEFEVAMEQLFFSLHDEIACPILNALERKLELPEGWFQNSLGPTRNSSQWHLKRYVLPNSNNEDVRSEPSANDDQEEPSILLPMHTDPSLISVVVHDKPGRNVGAMGLEHFAKSEQQEQEGGVKREWKEIPFHGHPVATIFVGSVLSHITGQIWPCAKHRVIQPSPPTSSSTTTTAPRRIAATLFVRPHGSALLQVPPSPSSLLKNNKQVTLKKQMTFTAWNRRVSANYTKKKKNDSSKVKSTKT